MAFSIILYDILIYSYISFLLYPNVSSSSRLSQIAHHSLKLFKMSHFLSIKYPRSIGDGLYLISLLENERKEYLDCLVLQSLIFNFIEHLHCYIEELILILILDVFFEVNINFTVIENLIIPQKIQWCKHSCCCL